MNSPYTMAGLKNCVHEKWGFPVDDIERIKYCGMWHVRFQLQSSGQTYYWYCVDTDDRDHLVKQDYDNWEPDGFDYVPLEVRQCSD